MGNSIGETEMDKSYLLNITEWERDALIRIMDNATYTGKDLESVVELKKKIQNALVGE